MVDVFERVVTEEFSFLIDDYLVAGNDEVVSSLFSLRERIFERLGINE